MLKYSVLYLERKIRGEREREWSNIIKDEFQFVLKYLKTHFDTIVLYL